MKTACIFQGSGFGFISYVLIKLFVGKAPEVHPFLYLVAFLFSISFATPWLISLIH